MRIWIAQRECPPLSWVLANWTPIRDGAHFQSDHNYMLVFFNNILFTSFVSDLSEGWAKFYRNKISWGSMQEGEFFFSNLEYFLLNPSFQYFFLVYFVTKICKFLLKDFILQTHLPLPSPLPLPKEKCWSLPCQNGPLSGHYGFSSLIAPFYLSHAVCACT